MLKSKYSRDNKDTITEFKAVAESTRAISNDVYPSHWTEWAIFFVYIFYLYEHTLIDVCVYQRYWEKLFWKSSVRLNNMKMMYETFELNAIRCTKVTAVVLDGINITRNLIKQKQVSTSNTKNCYTQLYTTVCLPCLI